MSAVVAIFQNGRQNFHDFDGHFGGHFENGGHFEFFSVKFGLGDVNKHKIHVLHDKIY